MVTAMLNGDQAALDQFGEAPVDYIEAQTSAVAAEEVDPIAVLTEALSQSDLDPGQQAAVMDAVNEAVTGYGAPEAGYTPDQLATIFAQGINVTVEEGDQIHVDNSLYVDGDVKGGITQHNQTNITDADDGAIIADGAHGSNFQTGQDNVQLTDVDADNITTGNNNTVASEGSVIGNENVNAHKIDNSEFGEGDQDRSVDVDAKITDSFNDDDKYDIQHSDDDVTKTDIDVDVHGGHGYEPEPYEPVKPVYEEEEHYEEPVHDDVYDG
ncbi:MAG: hypothetical protein AAFN30_17670 [Actinomycetota bacterium]